MLGLLGLRIFEATGADIADLGEEHGHRVLRVCGKGGKVVLIPLPPAVGRAIDRAVEGRASGPILRNRRGARMDRHAATRRLRWLAEPAVACSYHDQLGDELAGKPLDRAVLEAFTELAGEGTIADVGCGPGHVARFLATRHARVIGIDISPGMIGVAREHAPTLPFAVASMLQLLLADRLALCASTRQVEPAVLSARQASRGGCLG
jgi:hypothetical protein